MIGFRKFELLHPILIIVSDVSSWHSRCSQYEEEYLVPILELVYAMCDPPWLYCHCSFCVNCVIHLWHVMATVGIFVCVDCVIVVTCDCVVYLLCVSALSFRGFSHCWDNNVWHHCRGIAGFMNDISNVLWTIGRPWLNWYWQGFVEKLVWNLYNLYMYSAKVIYKVLLKSCIKIHETGICIQ